MGSDPHIVQFFASLATGRCFTIDSDGGARLVLELPESDAPTVAKALPVLRDCVFAVVCRPVAHG